jgi:adenine-specific DNA-methyltransferase
MMEVTARQTVLHITIYKRKKQLPLSAHDRRKSLYQAVSTSLPTGIRARTAYLHCIKDGTNIDPPYNTGGDFVYPDDFHDSLENYKKLTGQVDNNGNRISTNTETSGRYHTDWLNMMYPRLRLARNLLTDDGVIFISIDDNEADNLKKICNEVFGEDNFVACLVWEKKKKGAFLSKHFINMKEYILVFAKNATSFSGLVGELNSNSETYPCIKTTNARGTRMIKAGTPSKYRDKDYVIPKNTRISSGNMELIYLDEAIIKDGVLRNDTLIDSNWIYSQSALDGFANDGLIYITQDLYIRRVVNEERTKMLKDLLTRVGSDGKSLNTYKFDVNLNNGGWGTNEDANDELHQLLRQQYIFDFTKPSRLLAKIIQSLNDQNAIILDFFSGSSTTAHAVMQLNAEDGGNRKFIMVQLPEPTDEKSEAYKAGYMNICDIGKERIRRAGEKIKEENKDKETIENLDIGFKVLKLDTSNIRKWQPDHDNLEQSLLDYVDNYMEGRTELDVVYEIMLKYGLDLTYPVDEFTLAQKKVYSIGFGMLMICLDNEITTEVAKGILEKVKELAPESTRVVFKDNGFKTDSNKTNIKEILKSGGIEEFITI